jgi:hypothetical protein
MLDHGQETRVRYFWENILEDAGMDDENARYLIQGVWTKGFRGSTDDAMDFLREKMDEGMIDETVRRKMGDIILKYSKYR